MPIFLLEKLCIYKREPYASRRSETNIKKKYVNEKEACGAKNENNLTILRKFYDSEDIRERRKGQNAIETSYSNNIIIKIMRRIGHCHQVERAKQYALTMMDKAYLGQGSPSSKNIDCV